ncbi:MAG: putative glycoside hydrolase [Sulfuricurvum sp.]|uniref:putative glycoside hydrolase n=1 Tax=Sulfuricurvum sp. TaxID=2025608 RepID=UPI0026297A98|nr:putative glycoside hydrolase [Sulfuricurvum sp.]MDD2828773.1 putative glycoside hydrolase [Sulfuricurvum sp.]MDD4948768.1 putative glycoside hydrolase [Sulfuricurvum sp.]
MKALAILALTLSLSWGAMTTGTVYDKATSKPIQDAIIISGNKEYRTDSNGSFSVPPASLIGVRAVGYERKFYTSGGKMYLNRFIPKALYLSSFGATSGKIMGNAKNLIRSTEINALVIDVKMDRGQIAFKTANPIANKIGAQQIILFKDMKSFIADLHKEGIYVIARIVSFKDTPFVTAYPQYGVKKDDGTLFKDKEGLYWIDASRTDAHKYIIDIAADAATAGFDEVQFDYVRFPDRKGIKFSVENTQANRVKAIAGFLEAARTRLTPYNVFVSADIFGYVSWHDADIDIGQRVDALAPFVDYLSPMLYPSGFNAGIPGYPNPVKANYEIVKNSLDKALTKSANSPLCYRPWLQAFKDYAFDRRIYGDKEIRDQIRASEDFGSCGWILWNPRNVYTGAGLIKLQRTAEKIIEKPAS